VKCNVGAIEALHAQTIVAAASLHEVRVPWVPVLIFLSPWFEGRSVGARFVFRTYLLCSSKEI
jgi:hypothetical protein